MPFATVRLLASGLDCEPVELVRLVESGGELVAQRRFPSSVLECAFGSPQITMRPP